ncbi:MAG TPA: PaaI family thioesterase [Candidatus Eremiobacteraceae bacterium]
MSPQLQDDRRCFACGPENPNGLHMQFEYGDGVATCTVEPGQAFAGWSNIMHGGIVATLLDEAMAHATLTTGERAVTARLEVRFRKPVPTGDSLVVEGRVTGRRGRVLEVSGVLRGADGTVYANAQSRFVTELSPDG